MSITKESVKWLIIYNKYFAFNDKLLLNELQKISKDGRVILRTQKEFFNSYDRVRDILDNAEDLYDVLSKNKAKYCDEHPEYKLDDLVFDILKNPAGCLKSVISVWVWNNMITRIDCGGVELKNTIRGMGWKDVNI